MREANGVQHSVHCTNETQTDGSPDSSVSVMTRLRVDGRGSINNRGRGSGAHPASYPMGFGGSFHGGKATGS